MMYELLLFAIGVVTGSLLLLSVLLIIGDVREMRNGRSQIYPTDADLDGNDPGGDRTGV